MEPVLPLLIFLLIIYFLPAVVAHGRRHRDRAAIFTLVLLAGWTLVGWVGGFVWAMTDNCDDQPIRW